MTNDNEIEKLRVKAATLGLKVEPLALAIRQTVKDLMDGPLRASSLAKLRGISPTAASNRLRSTERAGFLTEHAEGRELIFELSPGVRYYAWAGDDAGPAACPRCGRQEPDASLAALQDSGRLEVLPFDAPGDVLT